MNANGIARGYMAKNMDNFNFLIHVIDCIGREFEKEIEFNDLGDENYIVAIDGYEVSLSKDIIDSHKNGYKLDKYILEGAEKKGFSFDKFRSGYVRYCFGLFYMS